MDTWLTSDTHFGHEGIIRHCGRPFGNAAEMDEALIENWNARVKPGDRVYHLGDFALNAKRAAAIRPKLNGTIRLIVGNHDDPIALARAGLFQRMYLFRVFHEQGWVASHVPMARHLCRAPVNLHGHIHNNPHDLEKAEPHQINLCVEVTAYAPVHLDEVRPMENGGG